jgi:hypothetical protein
LLGVAVYLEATLGKAFDYPMLAARSWIESPITLNVVTTVGSMLAGIGAVCVVLLAEPRYRLRYGPLTSTKLQDGSWQVGIYLSSRGRRDITRDAFDDGKPVELDIGVPIQRLASVWNSQVAVRVVNAQVKDTCLLVGPGLINRRQDLRFTVITDEKPVGLTCLASLIDVSVREQSLGPKGHSWLAVFVTMVLFYGTVFLAIAIVRSFGVRLQDATLQPLFTGAGAFIGVWNRHRNPYPRD